jgi:hypothetical protein
MHILHIICLIKETKFHIFLGNITFFYLSICLCLPINDICFSTSATPSISKSLYGNPGIGASCDGFSEGDGVIGFGDEGEIDFGVVGGIEVVGVGVAVVTFFIVIGRPHIFDSVVLTNLSFGLLGSHSFDFSCGDIAELVGGGEVDGDRRADGVCPLWA